MAVEETLLSAREVASQLRISDRSVLNMIQRGEFPGAFKAGQAWRIPEADLDAYVERQRQERRTAASGKES